MQGNWKNVPNALSALRVVLSIVLFCLIGFGLYLAATVCFVVAALTDFIDGWWARKFKQVTQLGRILDPFADKTLICGTFIFLAAIPELAYDPFGGPFGLRPWMAVVIVCREMLITALRSFFEQRNVDFSAKWSGKIKMGFQCIACAGALLYMYLQTIPQLEGSQILVGLYWATIVSVWVTVFSTIQSGWLYINRAVRIAFEV